MTYTPVIGLEVHVELKTKSKMFCGCLADYFGKKPNTHTCPVCLGLPGALPVVNKTAIDWCVQIGLALNCKIATSSKFDRKNYFYPDLPKGYQISQYDFPFCVNGKIELSSGKTIRIRRVHMEEDTGKLTHQGQDSLIDFNRSGVPLVEIVTEPDFDSAKDVKEYLQKLQQIVRYLNVSNADMEKGDMRLEPNISLRKDGKKGLPNYKVEVKNINSFKFVERAIEYEIKRQQEILEKNETPLQETRGWHEAKQKTVSQRSKEEAQDYRYFPEPDIPPINLSDEQINLIKKSMPEMPKNKFDRFKNEYKLPDYDIDLLTRDRSLADFFEKAVTDGKIVQLTPKQIANYIISKKIDTETIPASAIIKAVKSTYEKVSIDEDTLQKTIRDVLSNNAKAVEDYKNGKENAVMFLLGQVMRQLKGSDATLVKQKLIKAIKNND